MLCLSLALVALGACDNQRSRAGSRASERRPAASRLLDAGSARLAPTVTAPATTTTTDGAVSVEDAPPTTVRSASEDDAGGLQSAAADAGPRLRVSRLGESVCVRDPSREGLGAGVHGVFTNDRLELEVRNVRFACTPAPEYTVQVDGDTVVLRFAPAPRAALTRCACPHDQFLQVAGIAPRAYTVRIEESTPGRAEASTVVGTGRIVVARR
jgi:hypothetical protein